MGVKAIENAEKMQLWIYNPAKIPGRNRREILFHPGEYAF
jgi:hypothetical protein